MYLYFEKRNDILSDKIWPFESDPELPCSSENANPPVEKTNPPVEEKQSVYNPGVSSSLSTPVRLSSASTGYPPVKAGGVSSGSGGRVVPSAGNRGGVSPGSGDRVAPASRGKDGGVSSGSLGHGDQVASSSAGNRGGGVAPGSGDRVAPASRGKDGGVASGSGDRFVPSSTGYLAGGRDGSISSCSGVDRSAPVVMASDVDRSVPSSRGQVYSGSGDRFVPSSTGYLAGGRDGSISSCSGVDRGALVVMASDVDRSVPSSRGQVSSGCVDRGALVVMASDVDRSVPSSRGQVSSGCVDRGALVVMASDVDRSVPSSRGQVSSGCGDRFVPSSTGYLTGGRDGGISSSSGVDDLQTSGQDEQKNLLSLGSVPHVLVYVQALMRTEEVRSRLEKAICLLDAIKEYGTAKDVEIISQLLDFSKNQADALVSLLPPWEKEFAPK
eukprot:TRINITY_DN8769_c0_g2_i1.p1 TRINITY_DN8769_c0_g2~~TRINITY_DN8769_c0_g2_i1.p1  ORF type:complete len:500 (-),score=90.15 TRINITY_DN8769_c0_g2_i1:232-1554(-)